MIAALKQPLLLEPDDFLNLFPHRNDFIWAEYPDPEASPQWKTESRYPLHDRIVGQGGYLYGVRFGPKTHYVMLDLDISSPYHPIRNAAALREIMNALESLGLVRAVIVQSSDRGGIHLYFPFEQAQKSYQIATAVKACLEHAGFKVRDGWLEIFPHPRRYTEGKLSLYKAHRLPLQRGSTVLNSDFAPIYATTTDFVTQWKLAQAHNSVDRRTVQRILRRFQQKFYAVSQSAAKFLADLNAVIEPGWTDEAQTNFLVGRIALRAYIFHHVIAGGEPLSGAALIAEIVMVAQSLPGYREFCNHQHEIETRARDWARQVEADPKYYPYSSGRKSAKLKPLQETRSIEPTLNQQRAIAAQDRIIHGMTELREQGKLPAKTTARLKALTQFQISPKTLYKYKSLWHPDYDKIDHTPVENDVELRSPESSQTKEFHTSDHNKLVPTCAAPTGQAQWHSSSGGTRGETSSVQAEVERQVALAQAQQAALRQFQETQQQEQYQRQIQDWLDSGDPILQAEARERLSINPVEIKAAQPSSIEVFVIEAVEPVVIEAVEVAENDAGDRVLAISSPVPNSTAADVDHLLLINEPIDLSSVIAKIEVHCHQVGLSRPDLKAICIEQFGQSFNLLEGQQLLQLLDDLRQRPIPLFCPTEGYDDNS